MGENLSLSFEMRSLCVIVISSCCNLCYWQSCREETTDLARAQSALSKIIDQENNVCLSSHQQRVSKWKKLLRETLWGKYWLAGASSIHRSVCHLLRSYEQDTTRWDFSFNVSSPFFEEKDGAGYFSACIVGSRCLGESLIEQQDNKRACGTVQGTTSHNISLGSAPIDNCCMLKTVGWDDCWLTLQWCPVFGWGVANKCTKMLEGIQFSSFFVPTAASRGKTAAVWGICRLRVSWRTSPNFKAGDCNVLSVPGREHVRLSLTSSMTSCSLSDEFIPTKDVPLTYDPRTMILLEESYNSSWVTVFLSSKTRSSPLTRIRSR